MHNRGINIEEIIMVPKAKAKTMTSNLPLLTVLAAAIFLRCNFFKASQGYEIGKYK
jgi:hypothetical protein